MKKTIALSGLLALAAMGMACDPGTNTANNAIKNTNVNTMANNAMTNMNKTMENVNQTMENVNKTAENVNKTAENVNKTMDNKAMNTNMANNK